MAKSFFKSGLLFLIVLAAATACSVKPSYETVPNDPLHARIYTLDNGLKVYMSVNKETPRIQTYIAVRVGGKNDPAENTGLAHYFEHLMFKGTQQVGTQDYAAEQPLLDQIEQQFEIYRSTTGDEERKAVYHIIDSLSYEASKLAIPNEYDKLMAAIGANGTNAYTAFDMTVYMEDIPSNQIENWAKIQADRIQNNVIRGFHTELETVYEEKNMSLTRDPMKVYEALLTGLFPHHPYGQQTILGTQEHLKNPSITRIKEFFRTWYVPNNMAICMSGDFDPDTMIAIIKKYFGAMEPGTLPALSVKEEAPITSPVVREVLGNDAESITIGWRFPGVASHEFESLTILARILYNGKAGLIDLNLNQQQKALGTAANFSGLTDYSFLMLQGRPKEGQTLDQVKDLLLEQIGELKAGNFDENMLQATISNFKLSQMRQLEDNSSRASTFVGAFVHGVDWKDEVASLERMSKITKQEIVALANKFLNDNYVLVYKKQGKDPNEKKMDKPAITPIVMNRDTASQYLREIQQTPVTPIEPVFLDYSKDLTQLKIENPEIPVLYKKNELNDIFELIYLFDMGNANDKALGVSFQYMKYLGTSDMTPEQLNSEFYKLACSFGVSPGHERTYVTLTGLNENMPKALELFEKLLADAQVNKKAYNNMAADIIKARNDAKLNQGQNFSRLTNYAAWGPNSPAKNMLSASELIDADPQQFVDRIHRQNTYKHRILYYGPASVDDFLSLIMEYHRVPETLKDAPQGVTFAKQLTPSTRIFISPYDAKQIYMAQFSNRGEQFDPAIESQRNMYNEYFGGGMNSIVFQEMRESRGLAYSAWAGMTEPSYLKYPYEVHTQIATQNDKMMDAITTFNDIINNMPESESAFNLAKEATIARLRTERIVNSGILWSYIDAQDLGQSVDSRIKLYDDVRTMTLKDVVDFQKQWIKGRTYTYCILGDEKELDMKSLEKVGPVQRLTQEEIFGY